MPRVAATFADGDPARAAMDDLKGMGLTEDGLSLLYPEETETGDGSEREQDDDEGDTPHLSAAAASMATVAASLGGGLLAVPGAGTYIGLGPLLAGMSQVIDGGLTSALQHAGIPEKHAGFFAEQLNQGRAVAVADCDPGQVNEVAGLMRRHGATDVEVF